MTGLSELDNLLKGFKEGAVDYIVKPIQPTEVIARIDAQLSQKHNAQRVEQTLDHTGFSAIAFTKSGIITWLSVSANKILSDCYPIEQVEKVIIERDRFLPQTLLEQITPKIKAQKVPLTDVQIGSQYSGKIVPSLIDDEYLLLIQKSRQDWDLASLKVSFGLTAREAEILMWISRGKTNKEVGLTLGTSPRTVNKHLEHVFEKLGVPTRTAAVAMVLKN